MKSILTLCCILALHTTCNADVYAESGLVAQDQMSVSVEIDNTTVYIEMVGPDNTWFGFGFGNNIMADTYTIIATTDATGVQTAVEYTLGDHQRGNPLPTP